MEETALFRDNWGKTGDIFGKLEPVHVKGLGFVEIPVLFHNPAFQSLLLSELQNIISITLADSDKDIRVLNPLYGKVTYRKLNIELFSN